MLPGWRVAAAVPMWVSGGPIFPPFPAISWQLAQPFCRYSCAPRTTGSVAGASLQAPRSTGSAKSAKHDAASRPIIVIVNIAVALRGATIVLDDRAILRELDLDIGPGLTIVRGSNGAGKTTLLRAIAGLVPLARGTRTVTMPLLSIGHRPQLLRGLSARENLRFFAAFRGVSADGVDRALAAWGIADSIARRPVETLSAGQRRRAALARIDSEGASLVLLDEPFGELDDEAAALLRDALARLAGRSAAVVIATHGHHELDGDAAQVVQL